LALSASFSISAGSVPQNFYQKHLRKSRTASNTREIQAKQAMGRLAARITGREFPNSVSQSPSSNSIIVKEEHLSQILNQPYSSDSLNKALILQKRLSRPNYLLNEYIALCYWHTGQTIKAVELGNSVLRELESPKIRRILFSQAISERSFDLALHHLEKSGLSRYSMIIAQTRIFIGKADLPLILPALILLAFLAFGMKFIYRITKKTTADRSSKQQAFIPEEKFFSPECSEADKTFEKEAMESNTSAEFQTFYSESALTVQTENPAINDFAEIKNHESSIKSDLLDAEPSNFEMSQHSEILEETRLEIPETLNVAQQPDLNPETFSFGNETLKTFFLSLQLSLSQNMTRMISIISDSRSARKAAFALNLGKLFANDDYKTLLIDCNNASPFLHEEMGLSSVPGISDLTDPDCEITSIFRSSGLPQLYYITCGTIQDEITNISETAWDLLLDYCRKNYEIIILILPEAKFLSQNLNMIKNTGILLINDNSVPAELGINSIKSMNELKLLGELTVN